MAAATDVDEDLSHDPEVMGASNDEDDNIVEGFMAPEDNTNAEVKAAEDSANAKSAASDI